jgi:hypothetical protein
MRNLSTNGWKPLWSRWLPYERGKRQIMGRRPVLVSLLLVVGTITAGLTIRLVSFGLPTAVVKYGGSVLWAMMIYRIVSTIHPRWPLFHSSLASAIVASSVELFKLHHTPWLDGFRMTLPGKLLLGRVFSGWNLLAYAIAILVAFLIDRTIRPSTEPR